MSKTGKKLKKFLGRHAEKIMASLALLVSFVALGTSIFFDRYNLIEKIHIRVDEYPEDYQVEIKSRALYADGSDVPADARSPFYRKRYDVYLSNIGIKTFTITGIDFVNYVRVPMENDSDFENARCPPTIIHDELNSPITLESGHSKLIRLEIPIWIQAVAWERLSSEGISLTNILYSEEAGELIAVSGSIPINVEDFVSGNLEIDPSDFLTKLSLGDELAIRHLEEELDIDDVFVCELEVTISLGSGVVRKYRLIEGRYFLDL